MVKDDDRIIEGLEEFDIRGVERGEGLSQKQARREEDRDIAASPSLF